MLECEWGRGHWKGREGEVGYEYLDAVLTRAVLV